VTSSRNEIEDDHDSEPLPVDGLDVEEVRDPDTLQLFMREWRRRLGRRADLTAARGQMTFPAGGIAK